MNRYLAISAALVLLPLTSLFGQTIPTEKTPGVYTVEIDALPNSVVEVPTAIPAFVGYTARAEHYGKSYLFKPVKIGSLPEFLAVFGALKEVADGQPAFAAPPADQHSPRYSIEPVEGEGDLLVGGQSYRVAADPGTIYHLYQSLRLFYQNGGGTAYVVSVGGFGKPTGKPVAAASPFVNPNVKYADLKKGLDTLAKEPDPTMLLIPDGVLLPAEDYAKLTREMLGQAAESRSRLALFDLQSGRNPHPLMWMQGVGEFRKGVGEKGLQFGVAYYPWLRTNVSGADEVTYENLGGLKALAGILPGADEDRLKAILDGESSGKAPGLTPLQRHQALRLVSPDYQRICEAALKEINTLPATPAMAGIYTTNDENTGVWNSPANVQVIGAEDVTQRISNGQQESLNVDVASGKSIDAIRFFNGRGVTVWGARTLKGNDLDWRYVNVVRTRILIEQSVQQAMQDYVFAPNDAKTWTTLSTMMSHYLNGLWKSGGLVGDQPSAAYSVSIGLGSTMTAEDVLNGILRAEVKVALSHPAEFIILNFEQEMASSE